MTDLTPFGQTFQAIREPIFRRVWASSWCYYTARMMELSVLLWLVLELTGSPSKVALVGAFRTAPMFLLGLVVGSLADMFPRRHLLVIAQGTTTLVGVGMAGLLLTGATIEYWYAYVASFISGAAWTMDFSARRSLFSETFKGNQLVNAIALDSLVLTGSNMLGPLLGGVLIYLVGFSGAYVGLTAMYFIGLLLLFWLPARKRDESGFDEQSPISQVEAFKELRRNRTVWAALLVTVALNIFGFPFQQMVPVIAREVLGTGSVLYGVLASAVGLGAITGSLLIATGRMQKHGTVYSLGSILMVVAIFIFSFSQIYAVSVILLFLTGIGLSFFSTLQPVIVLQASPARMRGRALGAIALCIGFNPLGLILIGQMADRLGPQNALAILTGVGFVALVCLRAWYRSLRD